MEDDVARWRWIPLHWWSYKVVNVSEGTTYNGEQSIMVGPTTSQIAIETGWVLGIWLKFKICEMQ